MRNFMFADYPAGVPEPQGGWKSLFCGGAEAQGGSENYFARRLRLRMGGRMLVRWAANTGIAPICRPENAGAWVLTASQWDRKIGDRIDEGGQPGRMRLTRFAPSSFSCPQSSCPTPAWRLFVIQPDQHRWGNVSAGRRRLGAGRGIGAAMEGGGRGVVS